MKGKQIVELQATDDGSLEIRLNRYAEFDRINGPYLDWQFEQFRPYLGDRVLEIGCGVGSILERVPRCSLIKSLDVEADVLSAARQRFAAMPQREPPYLSAPDADAGAAACHVLRPAAPIQANGAANRRSQREPVHSRVKSVSPPKRRYRRRDGCRLGRWREAGWREKP